MLQEEIQARNLYNAAQYEQALKEYLKLYDVSSSKANIAVMIGNCYDKLSQKQEAMQWYEKACKQDKHNILAMSNYATSLYENKDYKQAQKVSKQVLLHDSDNVQSYINLGNIEYLHHDFEKAVNYYDKAYKINKKNYITCVNLANVYFDLKEYSKSAYYAQSAIEEDSSQVMAWTILGNSEFEQEHYTEALHAFKQAGKIDSQDYWLHNYLSQVYQKLEQWEEAFIEGWQALELSQGEDSQQINFGYLLYETSLCNNDSFVKKYAEKWLQKYPDNQIVQHMGKSVLKDTIPERANDEYLKNIFDVFAVDFEQVLSTLDYQAPQEINKYLQELQSQKKLPKLKILDAGCGTGLCGKFLKSYSKIFGLYGVDISGEMLKEAKKKNIYYKLYKEELEHFFSHSKQQFDMVVSADVFTYFGDLSKVFSGVSKCLVSGGRFIFTITENSITEEDYFLHASGRYLHHPKYIEKLLITNCFSIEKMKRCKLRNEGEKEVYGYLFSGVKKSKLN